MPIKQHDETQQSGYGRPVVPATYSRSAMSHHPFTRVCSVTSYRRPGEAGDVFSHNVPVYLCKFKLQSKLCC